jgi:hypothetical protein
MREAPEVEPTIGVLMRAFASFPDERHLGEGGIVIISGGIDLTAWIVARLPGEEQVGAPSDPVE